MTYYKEGVDHIFDSFISDPPETVEEKVKVWYECRNIVQTFINIPIYSANGFSDHVQRQYDYACKSLSKIYLTTEHKIIPTVCLSQLIKLTAMGRVNSPYKDVIKNKCSEYTIIFHDTVAVLGAVLPSTDKEFLNRIDSLKQKLSKEIETDKLKAIQTKEIGGEENE